MSQKFKTHRVGDATVYKVEEQELAAVPVPFLFPTAQPSDLSDPGGELRQYLEPSGDSFRLSVHTWVVRTPDHLILIDTGSGNDKERPLNPIFHRQSIPFLDRLRAAGVEPGDVDFVFNTHLHVDHSGWNTRLEDGKWLPTFPNARYVFPRLECEYYSSAKSHNDVNVPSLGVFEDSVAPIIDAGLADFIGPEGGRYLDIFEFIPSPGHSIGHMSIALRSQGETAIFGGDIMHSPIQVHRPDLNTVFCEFHSQAASSRRRVLHLLTDEDAIYFATHFPGSSAGVVGRTADGFTWNYF
jgi:glyoxylase-like metal-dependent hydrolase (beta-lactamase superfamily II)